MKSDWTLIRRIKGGHSYWERKSDGAIGIADNSGTYPENCEPVDKPPLLLDRTRPISLGKSGSCIPVTRNDGDNAHTFATAFEVFWVAMKYNMRLLVSESWDTKPVEYEIRSASV